MTATRRGHLEYAAALVLDLLAAGGALLIGGRTWQTVATPLGYRTDVLDLDGRTVDPASTALALVALAGVVAVLATRGLARRLVGVIIGLAGAGLVWRGAESLHAVGVGRARRLVADRHRTVGGTTVPPRIEVHATWPALVLGCGVLVLLAGLLIGWRGHRWGAMSARYENRSAVDALTATTATVTRDTAGADAEEDPQRAATSLWTALDRGEDPTSR